MKEPEYQYIFEEDEGDDYAKECDSCGSQAPLAKRNHPFTNPSGKRIGTSYFCQICDCTLVSSQYLYPQQHRIDGNVMKTIAQVGNVTIDIITKRQDEWKDGSK